MKFKEKIQNAEGSDSPRMGCRVFQDGLHLNTFHGWAAPKRAGVNRNDQTHPISSRGFVI